MSDLRNWEKNNGCVGGRQLLARLLKTKNAGAIGACAALLLAAGSGVAAENVRSRSSDNLDSIPVASPEFSEPLLGDDLLAPPAADGDLLDPTLGETLAEPTEPASSSLSAGLSDGAPLESAAPTQLGTIEEIPTAAPTRLEAPNDVLGPAPTNESELAAPAPTNESELAAPVPTNKSELAAPTPTPTPAPTAPGVAPAPQYAPSIVAEDAPKTDAAPRQTGSQNAFYGGVSEPARPSNNPYARIGQAEYHPSQFYGGYAPVAGTAVPPVAAYGQNLAGEPSYYNNCAGYWGGCCGFLQNLQLETGALAMRNPLDFEDSGNFGAQFALNWASAQPLFCGLNVQAGARATQLDFNGTAANGFETDDARTQVFWTAGVFFRAPVGCDGWSAGVVYDSLIEDYYRQYELSQLRAELSYSFGGLVDIGFRGAFALNEDEFDFLRLDEELTVEGKATATSYYTMFLRTNFDQGAQATVFGGVTEWNEAIVGATAEAPLSDSFAVKGGATYIIPSERGLGNLRDEETWNVSAGIVWYLGGGARANACGAARPLFDVADNGTFLQNFLR